MAGTLSSMTGYARVDASGDGRSWSWELRSVNAKGLDVRVRLPSGLEALDVDVKPLLAQYVSRGSISVTLTLVADAATLPPSVNDGLLAHYADWALRLHERFALPLPSGAELLALPGVLMTTAAPALEDDTLARRRLLPALDQAAAALARARQEEGARLAAILARMIDALNEATSRARTIAADQPQRLASRLSDKLADLLADERRVDPERVAQEVALLAAKADVREELDRLESHCEAARTLLAEAGPIGRAFDFLAQEFNREANTLCAKATIPELTAVGLEIKTLIDQLREQVQNIE